MTISSTDSSPTLTQLRDQLELALSELRAESVNGDIVELARLLVHDFNNFLNNIVLSLAVLEQSGGASSESIAPLRSQTDRIAVLIKEFHNYRRKVGPAHQSIDLNEVLAGAARRLEDERNEGVVGLSSSLELHLAPDLPRIMGTERDLARLAKFLLRNVVLVACQGEGIVRVRTSHAAGMVELTIEVACSLPPSAQSIAQFDGLANTFSGVSNLELVACAAIARRNHAKMSVESRIDSGIVIRLRAPAASN
jgi:light-regulated signal transduction histidine kinase (bacteriophytochrome)